MALGMLYLIRSPYTPYSIYLRGTVGYRLCWLCFVVGRFGYGVGAGVFGVRRGDVMKKLWISPEKDRPMKVSD